MEDEKISRMIDTVGIVVEIGEAFARIGAADIKRTQRRLGEIQPHEKALGTIHNPTVKKLWALAEHFESVAEQSVNDAKYRADTDEEAAGYGQKAYRAHALEGIVRNLFWAQAKDDIGGCWVGGNIGVRADWLLVSGPEQVLADNARRGHPERRDRRERRRGVISDAAD